MEQLTEQLKQLDHQIIETSNRLRELKKARKKIAAGLEHIRSAQL